MARSYTTGSQNSSDKGRRSYNGMPSSAPEEKPASPAALFFKQHWKVFPVAAVCIAAVSAVVFGVVKMQENKEDAVITKTWQEVQTVADGATQEEAEAAEVIDPIERGRMYSSNPMARTINWSGILAIDPNIKCWVYIPETNIDYPVAQPETWAENDYYLDHDVYGNKSSAGAVYMPAEVEGFGDRDIHKILIGHNMRNGSMFSSLLGYKDKGFWEVSPYIYLYYPDHTEKWLIYSPFHTTQADIIYNMPYEADTPLYQDLLDEIETNKAYDTATNGPALTEPLLTLTTCDRNSTEGADGRFVVNAKLMDSIVIDGINEEPPAASSEMEEESISENNNAE